MVRVLLVDDSPHAQRMGERILADEGYEVVTVSNADAAMIRLADADPDVVLADTVMPGRTGFDICQYLKRSPRHQHVRVILTAGVLESLDEEQARQVEADATLKKPFEATALLAAIKPLGEAAVNERAAAAERATVAERPAVVERANVVDRPVAVEVPAAPPARVHEPVPAIPAAPVAPALDAEQVRAAVTVALDAAMTVIADEITRQVLATLSLKKPEITPPPRPSGPEPAATPTKPTPSEPLVPPAGEPAADTVRRVSPVRLRPSSILGLTLGRTEHPPDRD